MDDPGHALLDISLTPHPGPLRRALLGHLAGAGARTVADLRRYALAETVYRSASGKAGLWMVGPLVGTALGATWAADRVLMFRLSPPDRLADRLRAEQYRRFRGETWLEERLLVPA